MEPDAEPARWLRVLGVEPAGPTVGERGRSGARVYVGRDAQARPVAVKVVRHDSPAATARAAREHAVYAGWAPGSGLPAPRLRGAVVEEAATVLVLDRHRPAAPAPAWSDRRWHAFADVLAAVHTAAPPPVGLLPVGASPADVDPGLGLDGPDRARVDALWSEPADRRCVRLVAEQLAALSVAADGPDEVLLHGDAHLGNVVLAGDGGAERLLLVDWAEVRRGGSAADLAFALTRAIPTGAAPPRQQLVRRYAERRGLDPAVTERAVTAAQLLVLVRQYPLFAAHLDAPAVRRLRAALTALTRAWSLGG